MSDWDQLTRLVPPPSGRPDEGLDWASVESEPGVTAPADLRQLVSVYGSGAFDGFLWLLRPAYDNVNLDMAAVTTASRAALESLAEPETERFLASVGTDIAGLTAWGITDNGDVCYWVPRGGEREYPVLVNESRGPEWYRRDGTIAGFLLAVLSGAERCPIFPDDFPSDGPEWVPE